MNRIAFFKRLGVLMGLSLSNPALLFSENKKQVSLESFFFNNNTRGNNPVIFKTPWNQNVMYDRHTYIDMQTGEWIKQKIDWEEIEKLKTELNKKIDGGKIKFSKGPVRLLDGLWQLEIDGQQNVYLIETKSGLILVDPGMESNKEIIFEQLNLLDFQPSDIKHILLTHCHVDHAHSSAFWQKLGAEIHIHNSGVNSLKTGNEITAWYLIEGNEREFPKVSGNIFEFYDGDKLVFDELEIYVCHTPGHTPDSSCFYFQKEGKNILISGDTVFHNGKHGWMGHPYSDYEQYLKSLWKLKRFAVGGNIHNEKDRIMVRDAISFDFLLPGHTAISLENVTRDIDKTIEIMSYTIQQRKLGNDYQWTEPYTFFAEREVSGKSDIQIEYR